MPSFYAHLGIWRCETVAVKVHERRSKFPTDWRSFTIQACPGQAGACAINNIFSGKWISISSTSGECGKELMLLQVNSLVHGRRRKDYLYKSILVSSPLAPILVSSSCLYRFSCQCKLFVRKNRVPGFCLCVCTG